MHERKDEVNLGRVLSVLGRRAHWIVLCVVLVAAVAFGLSERQTKQYTATASLVFNSDQLSQQAAGLQSSGGGGNSTAQQATQVQLLHLGDMAASTARQLGHGLTAAQVSSSLTINEVGNTNVVDVAATSSSPQRAAAIANTYSDNFVREQLTTNQDYFRSALHLVRNQIAALPKQDRSSPAGLALQSRAQSLAILAQTQPPDIRVAQRATPPASPSAPKVVRNTLVGAVLGLLLGIGIAFLLESLDRRMREPKELAEVYGAPVLGVVPESDFLARAASAGGAIDPLPPQEAEVFRMIRAKLQTTSDAHRPRRTVLVATAAEGEGNTTVAYNLARAAAAMGARTLLVEADLRNPSLAERLAIERTPGLSDVIMDSLPLGAAVQSVDADPLSGSGSTGPRLEVLSAGKPRTNPGALMDSGAMKALVAHAASAYDFVVIDAPPLSSVSDAFPLLRLVDGVVVVAVPGHSRRDVAEQLLTTLKMVEAPLLGVVANAYKARSPIVPAGSYAPEVPPVAATSNGAPPPDELKQNVPA